jgi:AcrR family transcriptional regulator
VATAVKPARQRRTQAERSATTRAQLLDATIDCLIERGWAGTTTTEVAERAGVSRGAQLHHFPSKAELVAAAVEHLFHRRHEEFRRAFEALPPDVDRAAAAIDLLWPMVSGPTFYAWLELAVAARTDPELRSQLAPIGQRFSENVERWFRELFPPPANPGPFYDAAPAFAFAVMEALAVIKMVAEDRPHFAAVRDKLLGTLKLLAAVVMPPTPSR